MDRYNLAQQQSDFCDQQQKQKHFSAKALVVEDNQTDQILIKLILQKNGIEVTIAEDGAHAVEKALENHFDIIFMDLRMTEMSGLDATKKLRKNNIAVPVIALTASAVHGVDEKCFAAGCDDYLTKPIDRQKLIDILTKYLPQQTDHKPQPTLAQ